MKNSNKGIHHISIISGEAQRNADFYVNTLGLRMVLKSVNQDDPGSYHLFYANKNGDPGSSITFFPWPKAVKAEYGAGETVAIAFSVPESSIEYWKDHFNRLNIPQKEVFERFGKKVLPFFDPDGLPLELIEDESSEKIETWSNCSIPPDYQIRGFWSATLRINEFEGTQKVLEEVLGFKEAESDENFKRLTTESPLGHSILLEKTDRPINNRTGRGTVHHVAFQAKDEMELAEMREKVMEMGLNPTEILDRHVFKSVYYRSPGGVLFEMATDGPGYGIAHHSEDEMGKKLFLPLWLEENRNQIEDKLTPIEL